MPNVSVLLRNNRNHRNAFSFHYRKDFGVRELNLSMIFKRRALGSLTKSSNRHEAEACKASILLEFRYLRV